MKAMLGTSECLRPRDNIVLYFKSDMFMQHFKSTDYGTCLLITNFREPWFFSSLLLNRAEKHVGVIRDRVRTKSPGPHQG
ncbi:hypothetical protein TNCT_213781 [Trichonephila clavata]|uniref:Uncharacterized protein n=1 Tax=Trichonephila clavata TaxID=2740835 RepID=A0A8X6K8N1_TRICU|nr:hypothetical protein TNCT_213781 [Trichonephila clavata]